jgi:hypothetical protein
MNGQYFLLLMNLSGVTHFTIHQMGHIIKRRKKNDIPSQDGQWVF